MSDRLTTRESWDTYWSGVALPMQIERGKNRADDAILDIIERFVPLRGASVVEIGGAPGQYLAYLHRHHRVEAHVLDYSEVGCAKTTENFRLLHYPLQVHHADLFSDEFVGQFDVVFSLGLIEHFADLPGVMTRHVRLLRPGGTLVVGCPNFLGVNGWFLRRLAPALMTEHNLETMDDRNWDGFEHSLGLTRLFRGYVGGFEPALFMRRERDTPATLLLSGVARALIRATRSRKLSALNSREISQYLIGVYRVA
ncbi:MAG: class I SAM-dependent methyltransferase [Archangium sp.]|nr:class I SAM-dependent methyltransferase [Archangium sp.]